jgi:DNA polymerase
MPVHGEGRRRIMVVGEAPGQTEDEEGVPFVGKAGDLLRQSLDSIGVDLDVDCWTTNAIICRPPKNEIKDLHLNSCRPGLLRAVSEHKPNVVILLGMSSVKQIIPLFWKRILGSITMWRGWCIPISHLGAWVVPTLHPSFINRVGDGVLKKIFVNDLKRGVGLADANPRKHWLRVEDVGSKVECCVDDELFADRVRCLSKEEGRLAFDFETTGLKPDADGHHIRSVSFCLEGGVAFAGMVTRKSERSIRAVMQSKQLRKVCSNIKYESRWCSRRFGVSLRGHFWDTMLVAHLIDNRFGITSLKFQSFVHFGTGDWESGVAHLLEARTANGVNMVDSIDSKLLLRYNAIDSHMTYQLMRKQMKLLGMKDES